MKWPAPCHNLVGVNSVWAAIEFSETKICDFQNAIFVNQQIVRLHILQRKNRQYKKKASAIANTQTDG